MKKQMQSLNFIEKEPVKTVKKISSILVNV